MQIQRIGLPAFRGRQINPNKETAAYADGTRKETTYGKFGQITEEKTTLNGKLIKDEIYHYAENGQYLGHTKKYYDGGNEYMEKTIHAGEKRIKKLYINGRLTDKKILYPFYLKNNLEAPPIDPGEEILTIF